MKSKVLLWFIFLYGCSYNNIQDDEKRFTSLSNVDLMHLDVKDNKLWNLKAKIAKFNFIDNNLQADSPIINLYEDNITKFILKGDTLKHNKKTNIIYLYDNVNVKGDNIEFYSSSLYWKPDEKIIKLDKEFTFTNNYAKGSGRSMLFNTQSGNLKSSGPYSIKLNLNGQTNNLTSLNINGKGLTFNASFNTLSSYNKFVIKSKSSDNFQFTKLEGDKFKANFNSRILEVDNCILYRYDNSTTTSDYCKINYKYNTVKFSINNSNEYSSKINSTNKNGRVKTIFIQKRNLED